MHATWETTVLRHRASVLVFLLAASLPFVVSFTSFLMIQRGSLLTEPEAYTAALKQSGPHHAPHLAQRLEAGPGARSPVP